MNEKKKIVDVDTVTNHVQYQSRDIKLHKHAETLLK